MKNSILVTMLAILLSGCGEINEGYYIVSETTVSIDKEDDPPLVKDIKKSISENIINSTADIYFYFTPTEVSYFNSIKPEKITIENGKLTIGPTEFNINKTYSGVELISDTGLNCGFYECEITIRLGRVKPDNKKLIYSQNYFKEKNIKLQKFYTKQEEQLEKIGFKDFVGELIYGDNFKIKLPQIEFGSFEPRNSGIYFRNISGLYINLKNENNRIYRFKNEKEKINGDLFIVEAKKEKFDYSSWLEIQDKILYKDKNGSIYYNMHGELEAFYYQYDNKSQSYIIGLANATKLETISKAYSMLRTINPLYHGEIASIKDLSLSQSEFEQKYSIAIADYFDNNKTLDNLVKSINSSVIKSVAHPEKEHHFNFINVRFPSETFSSKINYYFHKKTFN
ncbi:hypothetical protein, partial [Xenorhabdus sp. PB30.3]|uniref:hypothetical protein n=1 Tax=Xenorhabdus sp. PB30.3 TaxID=2788941 RepID=UPI001E55529A